MLYTIIKENSYQDSVNLMLLTNKIIAMDGVTKAQIMMGTPSNKDILANAGLFTSELEKAAANDMCIVVDTDDAKLMDTILTEIEDYLNNQSIEVDSEELEVVRSWNKALKAQPNANIALISVPGTYAASEIENALDNGLHAFVFSDNMSFEDELRLKQKAHEKGLLVMGPDCGTGTISGIPLAFMNVIRKGNIGVVGASGTGIQEVTTIIDRLGGGISHAIGTGGRDLSEQVGAITMMDAIVGLEHHQDTEVVVIISKPPAKAVRDSVIKLLQGLTKPVVAIFLGEEPRNHEGNVFYAHTLEETARIAIDLSTNTTVPANYYQPMEVEKTYTFNENQTAIKGLYSGGTLGYEASFLIKRALGVTEKTATEEGYLLNLQHHEVIDLGDDVYTQGKPHPMIDPTTRVQFFEKMAKDEHTAVILFDIVLGYGTHEDMAQELLPAIVKIQQQAKQNNRDIAFVCTVTGTVNDPQNYYQQQQTMKNAGVIVCDSNNEAIRTALALLDISISEKEKEVKLYEGEITSVPLEIPETIKRLVNEQPVVINVGLKKFTTALKDTNTKVVQYDWRPIAGGNERMRKILSLLK